MQSFCAIVPWWLKKYIGNVKRSLFNLYNYHAIWLKCNVCLLLGMHNVTLSERLKSFTGIEHKETEKLLIERIKSIHSTEDYILLLKIFYGYFAPVEQQIRRFLTSNELADLHERRNVSRIKDDLRELGYEQNIPVSTDLPTIESYCHAAGAMYVQEGSTLGGRHIARMISGKIENAAQSLSFFEGYKEKTDVMWNSFKSFINNRFAEEEEAIQVMEGARQTFVKMKDWIIMH